MKISKIGLLTSTALLFSSLLTIPTAALATSSSTTSEETTWDKPMFVAGAGLTAAQLNETMSLLNITATDVDTEVATAQDLINYLGSGSGDDSAMLSSVVVTKEASGSGIQVDIVTPANITLITAEQYMNPLVTAGITDTSIEVASVVQVTGESALTGVYKAFEAHGVTIDPDRAQLAQEELTTTTDIADEITSEASQDSTLSSEEQSAADEAYQTQLNQALVDIKTELAALKEAQGDNVTAEDVENVVNQALKDNDLSQYISQDSINQLIALAQKYLDTDGVLSQESLDQLQKISDSFKDTLSQLGDQFGGLTDALKANEGFFQNLWTSVKDFFTNLFN
ncbi:DUF1002 domain-containing protein [Enterococcus sp. LJL90]